MDYPPIKTTDRGVRNLSDHRTSDDRTNSLLESVRALEDEVKISRPAGPTKPHDDEDDD